MNGYDRQKREKTATSIRVSVWGKRAEQLAQHLVKGARVACSGPLEIGEYNGKPQFNLEAKDVTLMGGKSDSQTSGSRGSAPARAGKPAPADDGGFPDTDDDDIPF